MKNYYKESTWLPWWACTLLLFALTLPTAILLFQTFTAIPAWWHPAPTAALLILTGFFAIIILNFLRLNIKVDNENIRVGYGIIRKTIPWKEVKSCEATKARFGAYYGTGIRIGTDKSLAFTTSLGNAIRITRTNGHHFVFTTKHPAELSKIINQHLKPQN
jgi:hypothetical protein